MSHSVLKFVAALMMALLPAVAMAQTATGTISGVVRDSSGTATPGAIVRVINEDTRVGVDSVSDAQGNYRVTNLAPGRYRVEAALGGFETAINRLELAADQTATVDAVLSLSRFEEGVLVTARRVEEAVQEVPIPVSVITGRLVADAGAFNVNRLRELLPSVQFYATNPRNSALNIRGLGAPFGFTNDGIEPGVGLYVDGVFYARPASTTLDFIDVERIEVLRGPQGTLFGKNTTAGAVNITTRKPSFTREADFELNYGDYGYVQAKGAVSGPLGSKVAGRVSFSGTQRDGVVYNVAKDDDVNDLSNLGVRGQLLIAPTENVALTFAVDSTRQRPEGYAQVIAGVAPTLRAANRQWAAIAADLGYTLPYNSPFERITDTDTPWRSRQDLGGASFNLDWKLGRGQLTSTTAWRYWNWDPSNDRDWTGLSVVTLSQAPSIQRQATQEVRWAGDLARNLGLVVGFFTFGQSVDSDPVQTTQSGKDAWRYSLAPSALAATPGLLDGYGSRDTVQLNTSSSAVFSQAEWSVTDRFRLLPGIRFNYDKKDMSFRREVYGGLQTTDPALIALQRSVYAPQAYAADVDDFNTSGQLTAAFKVSNRVNTYATYASSLKSIGLNLGGLPDDAAGRPALSAATVRPERVGHFEVGVKTEPWPGTTVNITGFNTNIKDFQTQVQNAQLGVQRGYLANAEKVRVSGLEFESATRVNNNISAYASLAYLNGKYVKFVDAPVPLEDTGGPNASKDISGEPLPGVPKWAVSIGGEVSSNPTTFFGRAGQVFGGIDTSYRSTFSSSPTASRYLVIDGYALVNARVGFRWTDGWTLSLWSRNLLEKDYFEILSPGAGGTGLYQAQLGDPRTFGVSLRLSLR